MGDGMRVGERLQGLRRIASALGAVSLSTLAAVIVVPTQTLAQATAQAPAARSFSIASQPLNAALRQFADQSGMQLAYRTTELNGLVSPGVSGALAPTEALGRLLAGTGVSYSMTAPNTVTLGSAPRAAAPGEGAITLDPIDVEGAADGTVGFVATRTSAGTKTDTPILEIPQSISVVTRSQLDVRAVQTDAEALTYVPGIYAQPFGGAQNQQNPYFLIRGFSSAFGGSYVDGLISYVNYRYEPYAFQRYDVVRGPSSTLYGQSDPGGLVNRVSKLPTLENIREIQLQAGTFERLQGAIDLSGAIDPEGKVLYRVTGLLRDADAPFDYTYGPTAPDQRAFIAPAITFRPTEDTTITVLGNYLKDEIGQENTFMWPGRQLTHISLAQQGLGVWNQEQYAIGYLLDHRFNDNLMFRQKLRYNHMSSDILGVYQGSLVPETSLVTRTTDGNTEWRNDLVMDNQLEAQFGTWGIGHTVVAGFDYQNTNDWIAFNSGTAPDLDLAQPFYGMYIPPAEAWLQNLYRGQSYGLYAQDQIQFNKNWILTLGGRQDWVFASNEDQAYGGTTFSSDQKFTYRAGLTYLTDFGLAPYVSYTTSFLPTSGVDINGTPFEPTTGEQYELGVKYQPPGWNTLFTAAIYDLRKQNVLTPDTANFATCPFCMVQTGEVTSRGLELQATTTLNGWNLSAAYTYNNVEVTQDNPDIQGFSTVGKRPPWVPATMASLWLDYTFSTGSLAGLNVGGGVRYVGNTYADEQNTIENAPYTLFDAVVRYDLAKNWPQAKGALLAVNATNLFGTQYTTCFSASNCQWGAQRTVMATFTYQW